MCGLQPGGSMQLETKFPPPPRPSYDRLPLRRLASDLAGRLDQTPALLHRDDRPGQALNREAGDRAKGGSAGTPKFSDRPGGELHVVHSPPSLDFSSTKPTYTWWHLDGKLETVCSIAHHLRIEKIVQNADDVVGDVRRLAGAGRWRTKWTHAARWRRLGIMEGIGMVRRS